MKAEGNKAIRLEIEITIGPKLARKSVTWAKPKKQQQQKKRELLSIQEYAPVDNEERKHYVPNLRDM